MAGTLASWAERQPEKLRSPMTASLTEVVVVPKLLFSKFIMENSSLAGVVNRHLHVLFLT
jgi:hypothetical protein